MKEHDPRALIAALEILRRSVADLAASMHQNAQREADRDARRDVDSTSSLDRALAANRRGPGGVLADQGGFGDRSGRASGAGDIDTAKQKSFFDKFGNALGGQMGRIGGALMARFAVVMGPLAVLAGIISANNSGFQILTSSMKIFAATIAPVLLPAFMLLAAAVVNVSDRLWNDIAPGLEGFYSLVVVRLLPAVEQLVENFTRMSRWVSSHGIGNNPADLLGNVGISGVTIDDMIPGLGLLGGKGGGSSGGSGGGIGEMVRRGLDEKLRGLTPATPDTGSFDGGFVADRVPGAGGRRDPSMKESFGEVVREFRLSFGPKAQITSFTQLSKNAQLAAINQSPFEQKMLDRMVKAVEALERIDAKTGRGSAVSY